MTQSPPPRPTIPKLDELPNVIETPRLRLRPLALTDVDDLWPHVSDPALTPFMNWAAHTAKEETRTFVAGTTERVAAGTAMVWAIEHEGHASGLIGLHDIQWGKVALRVDRAELGFWLGIPLWNQGFMTEAAQGITRWGFETLRLHKVTVGCIEDNAASRRVIEKVGFRFVGRCEEDVWRDGRWWAHLRYELTAGEWGDMSRTLRFTRPKS